MKVPKSIKISEECHNIIEQIRKKPEHKRSFNAMVELLIENSPAYIKQLEEIETAIRVKHRIEAKKERRQLRLNQKQ